MHNLDCKHCKTKSLYAEYYLVDGYSYCKEFANILMSNVQKRIDILNQKKRLIRELYFSVPMYVIMSIVFALFIVGCLGAFIEEDADDLGIVFLIAMILEVFIICFMRVTKWIRAYVDFNGSKDPLYITYVVGLVLTGTLINIPIGLCMMISDIVEISRINKNLKKFNNDDSKLERPFEVGSNLETIECRQANQLLQVNIHHTSKEVIKSVLITLLTLILMAIGVIIRGGGF